MNCIRLAALVLIAFTAAQTAAQILPAGATLSQVATGYSFTEGPAYDGEGAVYFTNLTFNDQLASDIVRYDLATKTAQVVDPNSGGSNGLFRDANGQIVSADQAAHQLSRRSASDVSVVEQVLASQWDGKALNSPNDLVIDALGGIYFTDPDYNNTNSLPDAVYYRSPDGAVSRLLTGFNRPNGVILSPGGGTLYLAIEAERRVMAYDVGPPGVLSNERQFKSTAVDAAGNPHPGQGPDGMTIDAAGNVYVAVQSEIWAWSPTGQPLFELSLPESPTNVTFGGTTGRTLFITARTSLYSIELNVASPKLGDYDGDGDVTAADYLVWRDSLGATENLSADGDGDRVIDTSDYDIWRAHYGSLLLSTSALDMAATPEPGCALLVSIAAWAVALRRTRSIASCPHKQRRRSHESAETIHCVSA